MAELRNDNTGPTEELNSRPEIETAKIKELLGIPEIASIELPPLPHSSLYGIKIKLEPGSNLGPKQIFGSSFAGILNEGGINQVYPRCCFIIFDEVAPDKKLTLGELFSPKQQNHFFQSPHQDNADLVALYHPPLTESRTIPRMAPTMLTDAYNYGLFYYQHFRDELEHLMPGFGEGGTKELKELKNSIEQSASPTAEQLKNFYRSLPYQRFIPYDDHKKFLEQRAYAHNWQPNQLLIFNDALIFHNAGWIPENQQSLANLKNEQGLRRFDRLF